LRSNRDERQRVSKNFFYDHLEGETGIEEAYEVYVMMIKLQLEEGTNGSRQFL
jgi:hypothetical protein